jgi:hypothetical protein
MRRFVVVLSVLAIVAMSSSAVFAQFHFGNYYFQFSNWDNGGGVGSGPAWVLPTGPTATTDGAIWVKTGSTYALNREDFNAEIDFRDLSTGGTIYTITNTYLRSTGVAYEDVAFGGDPNNAYPGYWLGADGATGWGNNNPDSSSPYRMVANGNGMYYVPTADFADSTNFQFRLKIWQGTTYNSYDAAAATHSVDVADSGWFKAGSMASGIAFPTWGTFQYMPSLVLQPTAAPPQFPGDANLDGKVDVGDLSILLANYDRTGATWGQGDFTGDGAVNVSDLSILLTNYDKTASAGLSAVPEPSMLVLVALGGVLACAWRKWR